MIEKLIFFYCLYQRLFLKKFFNHNSNCFCYCWLLLNQLPQEYAMSTFFLDQHLLTASLPVRPILDAGALDEESVFLQSYTYTVYINCTFLNKSTPVSLRIFRVNNNI